MAVIIDGKALAKKTRENLKIECDELKEKGILALVLAMLSIMAYVSYRYAWQFAIAATLALIHDVVISAAAVIVFKIDLNLEVIAALLTLIGYSVNDKGLISIVKVKSAKNKVLVYLSSITFVKIYSPLTTGLS